MYIADTLSRAYLKNTVPSKEVKSLERVDHIEYLRVSLTRLAQIEHESVRDPVCATLRQVILQSWPSDIRECVPAIYSFFKFRGELISKETWFSEVLGYLFPVPSGNNSTSTL